MYDNTADVTKIAKYLQSHKTLAPMKQAVRGLFTESEITEMSRRLEIIRLLKKEYRNTR